MPAIDVTIVHAGDPAPWEDVTAAAVTDLADPDRIAVAVLEHGMTSGAPSIALRLDLDDGHVALAETSLAAWVAVTCAMRGAFPEAFAGTPLADPTRPGPT